MLEIEKKKRTSEGKNKIEEKQRNRKKKQTKENTRKNNQNGCRSFIRGIREEI